MVNRNVGGIRFKEIKISYLLILAIFVVEIALLVNFFVFEKEGAIMLTPIPIAILFLFFQITITVDYSYLHVFYGAGFISRLISLAEIKDYRIVSNNSFQGWMFNPLAKHVLLIYIRDQKPLILPVNEPRKMIDILSVRI